MPEHGLRGRQGEQRPAEPGAYGWVRFSARGPWWWWCRHVARGSAGIVGIRLSVIRDVQHGERPKGVWLPCPTTCASGVSGNG
jgi:hypothetical protein